MKLRQHKTATSCKSTCSTLILSSLTHSHSLILDTVLLLLPPVFFCSAHLATLLPRRSHAGSPPGPRPPSIQESSVSHASRPLTTRCSVGRSRFQSLGRKPLQIRHEDVSSTEMRVQKSRIREILDFSEVFNFGVHVLPDILREYFKRPTEPFPSI